MLYEKETEEHICQEILDSVKECPQHKWISTVPRVELRCSPSDIPRLDPKAEFQARSHATYNHFMDVRQDSCEEALTIVRDAHQ